MLELDVQWRRGSFTLHVEQRFDAGVTGLFGPSGAGKSSLLGLIAGHHKPDAGAIRFADLVLCDTSNAVFIAPQRRPIVTVFQEHRLFPNMIVAGNLRFGHKPHKSTDKSIRWSDVIDMLEIGDLLDRRVHQLSGGQAQRVALGRALLTSPRLLLLDEPVASLDAGLKRRILPLLRRIHEATQTPMIFVSHNIGDILQLTDRIAVIDDGKIIAAGPFHDVIGRPGVFRIARDQGLENVLLTRVDHHTESQGLTSLRIVPSDRAAPAAAADPAIIVAPLRSSPIEQTCHVAIRPEDIAIATGVVPHVSIQNQLPGCVVRLTDQGDRVLVEVDVGSPLLAEVSRKSVNELRLEPGRKVRCLFKANAIRYLDDRP